MTTPDSGVRSSTPPEISSVLNAVKQRESEREEEPVVRCGAHRDPKAEPDQQRIENHRSADTDESPLLAEHRKDQVRVRRRHDVRIAEAETGAERVRRCAMAQSACTTCSPPRTALSQGDSHIDTRSCTVFGYFNA